MTKKTNLRTEVVLTDADQDIIDLIEESGLQRATFFKMVARFYASHRNEEQVDERVKRLIGELVDERGFAAPSIAKVDSKKRLGFGAKKV